MQSGKYTIDRFEGDTAVFLYRPNESIEIKIPRSQLSFEVKEADIFELTFHDGSLIEIIPLSKETEQVKKHANALLREIVNKNNPSTK